MKELMGEKFNAEATALALKQAAVESQKKTAKFVARMDADIRASVYEEVGELI